MVYNYYMVITIDYIAITIAINRWFIRPYFSLIFIEKISKKSKKYPQNPCFQKPSRKRNFFVFLAGPEIWGQNGYFDPRAAGHIVIFWPFFPTFRPKLALIAFIRGLYLKSWKSGKSSKIVDFEVFSRFSGKKFNPLYGPHFLDLGIVFNSSNRRFFLRPLFSTFYIKSAVKANYKIIHKIMKN